MANLPAISADGQSIIYIEATGSGTNQDPFRVANTVDTSAIEAALSGTAGYAVYRNTALSNTKVAVKATPGSIVGWAFYNPNTVPVYVKVYNLALASVTVGTSPVLATIFVPPGNAMSPGVHYQEATLVPQIVCSSAITIAAIAGLADNATTAPTTPIHAEVLWE